MHVFLSWSGEASLLVALKLREWLPLVLPSSVPWLSSEDIRKGTIWLDAITDALRTTTAGIFCVTAGSVESPWLLFEAGAVLNTARRSSRRCVCTYLIDDVVIDARSPLSMFQSAGASAADTLRLLKHLNGATKDPLPEERLRKLFDAFWPELAEVIMRAKTLPQMGFSGPRPPAEAAAGR
jgi:hypothetical protein